ncbi:PepSY domain-containing protein [Parasaccharibacter sp. TMW 2.1891]|nr:PepSY domain-containing protein [Parasaccharibacter sp. TMW 2.1891]
MSAALYVNDNYSQLFFIKKPFFSYRFLHPCHFCVLPHLQNCQNLVINENHSHLCRVASIMSPRLRTALRLFHRWIGFPAGLFLFVLCFTGSLACFSPEIQGWMQPRTALHSPLPAMTHTGLLKAGQNLKTQLDTGIFAFLKLPSPRDPVFRLWHYDGRIFLGPALAPDTGLPLTDHDVTGGTFFVTLHASLHLPNPWGQILTTTVGIGLLVTLLTGLWLQLRRFLPDLLLFRPRAASQRRWLDLHLLCGTLSLPVLFIIGLSGVILQSQKLIHMMNPPHHPAGHASRHQAHTAIPPSLSPAIISSLTENGLRQWGTVADGFFMQTGREIGLYGPDTLHFCLQRQALTPSHPTLPPRSVCPTVHSFFVGLHNLRWAGLATRWFYCFSGLMGCIIIGSGLVLFLQSERNSITHHPVSSTIRQRLQRSHEAVTIATTLGLPLATLALFWSTRLPTPFSLSPILWEKSVFFGLWSLSLLHAFIIRPATCQQLALVAVLGTGTTGLDLLTRPFHTGRPLLFGTVDLLAACLGLAALSVLLHLFRKQAA